MTRILKLWAAIAAAVVAAGAAIAGWWLAITRGRQYARERQARIDAEVHGMQTDADAAAAKARAEAAQRQADALAKLNQEVVRVAPNSSDLAGAFDRATGGGPRPIGPDDDTSKG